MILSRTFADIRVGIFVTSAGVEQDPMSKSVFSDRIESRYLSWIRMVSSSWTPRWSLWATLLFSIHRVAM